MAANEAKIVFTGDTRNAVSAVGRLKTELASLDAISSKALGFGLVGAATAAVAAIVTSTKAIADQGDALNKMSQKTGLAVEELSKLQYAAGLSGVSTEALQKGLVNLSGGMVEAATGAGPLAEKYQQLGISLRNTDGTMKSSGAVLAELADRFQAMPDGVEKTALATDLFGKKLGAEMIPLLNGGAAGLKAMGDEAEALGLVMNAELAKQSEEFNDNLERMQKLAAAVGLNIASSLIPALNEYMAQMLDAKKAGLGFFESMWEFGTSNPFKTYHEHLSDVTAELEKIKKLAESRKQVGDLPGLPSAEYYEKQIAQLEKLKKYYELQTDRETGDGVQSAKELAAQRTSIERQLQAKLAEIAQLRAIAEGKVSADILDTDDKRTAAQIKNAEKVRDSLTAAWKSALKEAEAAGAAAAKLFDDAANTRASGADRAAAKRRSALSPEEQQAEIQSEFETAASTASNAAAQARYAEMFGRTENASKLAKEAERAAEKAAKLADQIDDPELGARAIEQAAEIQAQLQEAQARQKQAEQQAYQKQAETTAANIAQLDEMITGLQAKAAALKVQADISEAQGQLATLKAELDNLSKGVTVPVTVNTTTLAGINAASGIAPGTGEQFARGGWTGPGGKYQPAGIVHADEFVIRSEITRQRGVKELLARLNRGGLAALNIPGYANGGLVGNIRIPSIAPRASVVEQSGTPINLYLDGHRMPLTASADVAGEIKALFSREALRKGGRR